MKTNTTPQKEWQTPQVFDLDVNDTKSGTDTNGVEGPGSLTNTFCAPSS